MKAKDLREKSPEDLKELEKSTLRSVFDARFRNFTNRLDDTSTIAKTKRDLARVKTLLRQAELTALVSRGSAPRAPRSVTIIACRRARIGRRLAPSCAPNIASIV